MQIIIRLEELEDGETLLEIAEFFRAKKLNQRRERFHANRLSTRMLVDGIHQQLQHIAGVHGRNHKVSAKHIHILIAASPPRISPRVDRILCRTRAR